VNDAPNNPATAYDGIALGDRFDFGAFTFTAEAIKRFARDWDSQRFHINEEEAAKTHFGALAASGWHTASAAMRLQVDFFRREAERAAASGEPVLRFGMSPGIDDLKWLKPVRVGDRIAYDGVIVAKRKSESRPGWAIVSMRFTGTNQDGEEVFAMVAHVFVATD
jgi:acyl dehydratase